MCLQAVATKIKKKANPPEALGLAHPAPCTTCRSYRTLLCVQPQTGLRKQARMQTLFPNMLEKRRRLLSRRIARGGLAGDARERALV